jgi:phage terminase large subunit-like protein
VFIFVPRKNGKSFQGAGFALYGLVADGEMGAECVSAAVDRLQARLIFDVAKQIVERNPRLSKHITPYSNTLVVHRTASKYSVLSADVSNKHGTNPSTIVFDELHTQPNGDLVSVLETGIDARAQPLTIYFTTAGFDRDSICYETYLKAKAVAKEPWRDPTFLPVIYEAEEGDDWKDEATWKKANPNYGVSFSDTNFRIAFNRALENPRKENEFKQLRLNIWTQQNERWLSMDQWDACGEHTFRLKDIEDLICVGGLDLSSKSDLTALVLLFSDDDGYLYVQPYFWLPETDDKTLKQKEDKDRVPYRQWVREGYIELTPGDIIDYAYIRRQANLLSEQFRIREIGFDPYRAEQIAVQLGQDGITMVEVRQGFSRLSEPSKELEALLQASKVRHNNNPVLRWMAGNVAVDRNAQGDIMPSKKLAKQRIDGIAALVTGLSRLIVNQRPRRSKYEEEGLFII